MVLGISNSITEVFGLFPDPTAAATIAILAGYRGVWRWVAMIVPLCWCVAATTINGTLMTPTAIVLPLVCGFAIVAALMPGPADKLSKTD